MCKMVLSIIFGFVFSVFAKANPLPADQVPDPLKPWINWVLHDQTEYGCPFVYNSFEERRCSWPSRLMLNFTAAQGSFAIDWNVFKESWIELPGNLQHWPQNVTANGESAAVLDRNGIPSIKLAPGQYRIMGGFFWNAIPESLYVPGDTGLIDLTINGVKVAVPTIRDEQLWLTETELGKNNRENVQNSLDIQVFRKITDDVPMTVTTRLVLEVSGEQREVKLEKPLLDGFIPLNLQSALPARIEPDGQLLLQLRPGRWQLDIESRSAKETNVIPLSATTKEWPESELWIFESRPDLRLTEVEKLEVIDASQTNAPEEWRHLPTYQVKRGDSMTLKVVRRGDPDPEPNQLAIKRKLWLDFDGSGYTINDTISGKITRSWRLNALEDTKLGKVALDGNSQLITVAETGKQGVEVRRGAIALDADSRIEGKIRTISAVGWEQNFKQVDAELNLPPGWRLLAAGGVDNVPDSWIARWTLLDLFLVLIAALATNRLFGRTWGAFTLITLTLIWHETGSPHYIWLNILAAIALINVLPSGKFKTAVVWYRNLTYLFLALATIPFMVDQIRTGIYPQLEYVPPIYVEAAGQPASPAQVVMNQAEPETMDAMTSQALEEQSPVKSVMPQRKRSYESDAVKSVSDIGNAYNRYDPDAKVQTGPGLPQWQWRKIYLSWNGSVDARQQLHLWYLPPTATMLLNFLRVGLVSILALLMLGLTRNLPFKLNSISPAIWFLAIIPMFVLPVNRSYADTPTKEVLDELKTRLLEAPDCLPNCAQIASMKATIDEKSLTLSLQVHAQQTVNLPLPASYEQWFPNRVDIDGTTANGLYRNGNSLWINVPAGKHALVMTGVTPLLSTFTLPLPLKPAYISVSASGWEVSGLREHGQSDNQLQFVQVNKSPERNPASKLAAGILPTFVKVERTLKLGLDWHVVTQVVRQSPPDSAIVLDVPLLPGELVTSPGIHIVDGKVAVNMPAQQTFMEWESTLEKSPVIELKAVESNQWIEVWKADISPIWHVTPTGIAMNHLNAEGQWLPEWHPWPGEKLSLQIIRPKTLEGQILTIDNSRLSIRPGKRTLNAELTFSLRSSQGTQHSLTLPEHAVLQKVMINGQTMPLRLEGRKLAIPVNPGKQEVWLNWQESREISAVTQTPLVDLGTANANTTLNVGLGQDRWVLFVWGPKLGPAVLFWGVLVVILMLSVGLGKIKLTPLKHWHWFLLLTGLSQVPMESAALVVAWLILLGWRSQRPNDQDRYFNALQIVLGLLTVLSLGVLIFAVEQGLLGGSPNMQITGNNSSALDLNWFQDRSPAQLPKATVFSLPLLVYRILMLLWSFWLAASLLDWLKWGWACFSSDGFWKKEKDKAPSINPSAQD